MNKLKQRGFKAVFGIVQDLKPIINSPAGKILLRMRNTKFARLFVKTKSGIRKFWLEDRGEIWFAREEGRNERNVKRGTYDKSGANIIKSIFLNPNLCTVAQ